MEASPSIRKYGIAGLSMLGAGGAALGASGGEAKAEDRDRLVNSLSK